MPKDILRYTLRVDRSAFQKFRYIAEIDGRSANKQIEQYIKRCVAVFEKKYGEIKLEEEN